MRRRERLLEKRLGELSHQNWKKRRQAMQSLAKLGEDAVPGLIALFDSEQLTVRLVAAETLEMIGEDAAPALVDVLTSGSPIARRHAAGTLGQLRHQKALSALVRGLRDSDVGLRRASALALGALGAPAAVEGLTAALEDDDPTVRGHSAEALGRIAEVDGSFAEPAVPQLIRRLRDVGNYMSSQRRVCDAAADALRRIPTPDAQAALEAYLSAS